MPYLGRIFALALKCPRVRFPTLVSLRIYGLPFVIWNTACAQQQASSAQQPPGRASRARAGSCEPPLEHCCFKRQNWHQAAAAHSWCLVRTAESPPARVHVAVTVGTFLRRGRYSVDRTACAGGGFLISIRCPMRADRAFVTQSRSPFRRVWRWLCGKSGPLRPFIYAARNCRLLVGSHMC